jgi:hypothetical protein
MIARFRYGNEKTANRYWKKKTICRLYRKRGKNDTASNEGMRGNDQNERYIKTRNSKRTGKRKGMDERDDQNKKGVVYVMDLKIS